MIKRVFLLLDLILFFQMVLYEKMNGAQTLMWALILLFLPGIGTVLYIFFRFLSPHTLGQEQKGARSCLNNHNGQQCHALCRLGNDTTAVASRH